MPLHNVCAWVFLPDGRKCIERPTKKVVVGTMTTAIAFGKLLAAGGEAEPASQHNNRAPAATAAV
jgi:hypothetical protein